MDAQVTVVAEDVQVAAKPRRRTYTAEYKRRILKEADACTTPGAVGALLRREGLYSSHLVEWCRARPRVAPHLGCGSWHNYSGAADRSLPRGPPVLCSMSVPGDSALKDSRSIYLATCWAKKRLKFGL